MEERTGAADARPASRVARENRDNQVTRMFVVRLSPREVEEGGCEVGGGRRETGVIYMTLVDNWRDMTELGQGQRARALGWEGYGLGPTAALAIQLATAPASLPFSATRSPGTPSLFPAHPLPRPPRPRPDPPSPWLATPPRPARPLPPSTRIIVSSTASTARYAPDRLARRPSLRVFD